MATQTCVRPSLPVLDSPTCSRVPDAPRATVRDQFYANRFKDVEVDEVLVTQYCLPPSVIDAIGPADADTIILPPEVAAQRRKVVKSRSQKHMAKTPCVWMQRFGNCPFMRKSGSCPFSHE